MKDIHDKYYIIIDLDRSIIEDYSWKALSRSNLNKSVVPNFVATSKVADHSSETCIIYQDIHLLVCRKVSVFPRPFSSPVINSREVHNRESERGREMIDMKIVSRSIRVNF